MEFLMFLHPMINVQPKSYTMKNFLRIFGTMILVILVSSFIQSRTITGKVTDINGNLLPGVKVSVIPASSATLVSTTKDGTYKINVSQNSRILVFSYPGLINVEEEIGERNIINVSMICALVRLEELNQADYSPVKEARSMPMSHATGSAFESKSFQRYNYNFNTEGYASINENGFRNVKANPLSTFSIDVDNASYSNVRRFINNGQLPPADAVRIEEMINYFRYEYPEPKSEHPFSVYTEMAVCPWNKSHQILHIGLRGKSIDKSSLPPSNLVFLIDVSGSMNAPNKLPLLKSAFGLLVNELREKDRVAIVVYAGAAGLVLESTPGNHKEEIMAAIGNLDAGGSTAGGAGLKLAYNEAEKNFVKGGNNRIILATDGDFNIGESSNGGIERLVEEKRRTGVFITVLGFGMGNIKDDKMEIIADKGNGNYSYIDNIQEARKVLVSEFGGTLFTIAKDVKFQVEFNPARVKSYRLIGYENRLLNEEDFNDDRIDAGEMGSGHNVTALYELIPSGSEDDVPAVDPLKYQSRPSTKFREDGNLSEEYLTIKLRYKMPDGGTSKLFDRPVKGYIDFEEASDNLKFAAAVAEFGMILRNSEFKGNATLDMAAMLAKSACGEDEDGYRAELIRMINVVKDLKLTAERKTF
jgi:Ca-activated chloride channel homolog